MRHPQRLRANRRNKRILFSKMTAGVDGFGHATVNPRIAEWTRAWAGIQYGAGSEQRDAAQVGGSQTATFDVPANRQTAAVSVRDRICYPISDPDPAKWPVWEIQAVAELGFNEGYAFTATRVAS